MSGDVSRETELPWNPWRQWVTMLHPKAMVALIWDFDAGWAGLQDLTFFHMDEEWLAGFEIDGVALVMDDQIFSDGYLLPKESLRKVVERIDPLLARAAQDWYRDVSDSGITPELLTEYRTMAANSLSDGFTKWSLGLEMEVI
jgi:hypothetical protein